MIFEHFHLVSREASFMYAAVSAGITHGVTKDCSLGGIRNCGCEKMASVGANGNQVKWECDPDVAIRTKISRSVIEDGLLKWDAEALMNRHNSDIGRRVCIFSAVRSRLSFCNAENSGKNRLHESAQCHV